ncbi:hypothetical protein LX32DRAFT_282638 [Colletotrichum zoysiae]|uniref:Uncharacterized protein n=1 Tax=Colletotrichum zoysiae TaxID=1216348 RepID=A0AAD9H2D5_9PEZI|nr:hypothetical protein LX32DRAFT_282638 [Colletotrichum zoysiae]
MARLSLLHLNADERGMFQLTESVLESRCNTRREAQSILPVVRVSPRDSIGAETGQPKDGLGRTSDEVYRHNHPRPAVKTAPDDQIARTVVYGGPRASSRTVRNPKPLEVIILSLKERNLDFSLVVSRVLPLQLGGMNMFIDGRGTEVPLLVCCKTNLSFCHNKQFT